MCILQCNQDIIPDPSLPREEWYRELSKFYVAMTRAKLELIVSYSYTLSNFIQKSREYFNYYDWVEHVPDADSKLIELPKPKRLLTKTQVLEMTGDDFIYTRKAIGCPVSLQEKLVKSIRGKNSYVDGKQEEWENIESLLNSAKRDMHS
jgi:hypothetical protein